MAPPPTGYGVGISGIGSRVAYVPQMQDYEYGDLGYDPTVGTTAPTTSVRVKSHLSYTIKTRYYHAPVIIQFKQVLDSSALLRTL